VAIDDFFDVSYELEDHLNKTGKADILKDVRELRKHLQVVSIRQHTPGGLGHAVLCAAPAIEREPFAVLLGDELLITEKGKPSGIGQLARSAESSGLSTVAVIEVERSETLRYGIVDAEAAGKNLWKVKGVIEKPAPEKAPSQLALPGRYVFNAEILDILRDTKPGHGGEIQLSDAMNTLAKRSGLMAMKIEGRRFDAGDKLGFLMANVEMALQHPELGAPFRAYLTEKFGGNK
jgi:UTP--glucose-1-phosphate uridylyltransferase